MAARAYISERTFCTVLDLIQDNETPERADASSKRAVDVLGEYSMPFWNVVINASRARAESIGKAQHVTIDKVPVAFVDSQTWPLWVKINRYDPVPYKPVPVSFWADEGYICFLVVGGLAGKAMAPDIEYFLRKCLDEGYDTLKQRLGLTAAKLYLANLCDLKALATFRS